MIKTWSNDMNEGTTITFLGVSCCIPNVGLDSACFLINGRHLVDTGWGSLDRMRRYGFEPLDLESIIFTHLHHDHYLGLPHLLFYLGLRRRPAEKPIKIIGPSQDVEKVAILADEFLQISRYPELKIEREIIGLNSGGEYSIDGMKLTAFEVKHSSSVSSPIQALAYKLVDEKAGVTLVFTGDTHFYPPVADFARGSALLIHDGVHTPPAEAAEIARRAGVGKLALIHFDCEKTDEVLAGARGVFPMTFAPKEGETIRLTRGV